VELEGGLLFGDLLIESLVRLVRGNPLVLFKIPFWLVRGKRFIRQRAVGAVHLAVASMPVNANVLRHLEQTARAGHSVYLSTETGELGSRAAEEILDKYEFFTAVLDGGDDVPDETFEYVGQPRNQLARAARKSYLMHPSGSKGRVSNRGPEADLSLAVEGRNSIRQIARLMRPEGWAKNVLLFVPLFLAHLFSWDQVVSLLIAFAAFSALASAIYIANDLIDLPSDRSHPVKRARPLASGMVSLSTALILCILLLVSAFAIAGSSLPMAFSGVIALYAVLVMMYSLLLKTFPIVDIFVLASFYVIRIVAGGAAIDVHISPWLLSFSSFLFLSLATLKRFGELRLFFGSGRSVAGRGYREADIEMLRILGLGLGLLSVVVLALYITSDQIVTLYRRPELLWIACPFILFWIVRMWFRAERGAFEGDPLMAALRDPVSYFIAAVIFGVTLAGSL
jgi:4-hydroxybenzoate polyprenyltransferase